MGFKNAAWDLLRYTHGWILTTFAEDREISANDEKSKIDCYGPLSVYNHVKSFSPFLSFPSSRSSDLQYEYFNAVLINEVDEAGNSMELGGEFILQPNDHFNNLSVNLSLSVVQVPTNMYNKGKFAAFTYDRTDKCPKKINTITMNICTSLPLGNRY